MQRVLVAMVSAGVVTVAGCTGGDPAGGSSAETPGPPAVEEGLDLVPFTEPGGTGAVELVEANFTRLVNADGEEPVGFGFVVENSSGFVATDTEIRVDLTEESGVVVWTRPLTVSVLAPGQRIGAGEVLMPASANPVGLRVTVGGSLWYPVDSPDAEFGELTLTETNLDYPEDCVWGGVSFAVDSSYARELAGDVTGVLRDGDGAIIGGTGLESPDDPVTIAPGSSQHEHELRGLWGCGVPAGADRREVTAEFLVIPQHATG